MADMQVHWKKKWTIAIMFASFAFCLSCASNRGICHKIELGPHKIVWGATRDSIKMKSVKCSLRFTDVLYPTLDYAARFAGLECGATYYFLASDKLAGINISCLLSDFDFMRYSKNYNKAKLILESEYGTPTNEMANSNRSFQNIDSNCIGNSSNQNLLCSMWDNKNDAIVLVLKPSIREAEGVLSVILYSKLYDQQLQMEINSKSK